MVSRSQETTIVDIFERTNLYWGFAHKQRNCPKKVRDCILNKNAWKKWSVIARKKSEKDQPYILSNWRDLHVRSGCVCWDQKIAIPNVLREAFIGTRGMICMDTHCWWTYTNRELIIRSTQCKLCMPVDENSYPWGHLFREQMRERLPEQQQSWKGNGTGH